MNKYKLVKDFYIQLMMFGFNIVDSLYTAYSENVKDVLSVCVHCS